ncbi:DUF1439 domain-containing protein [Cupriavidus plantarum]|uniref:Uncharacterized protein DUF1439 n=2 Tax=Cupriavidus plantarum TaxID=942865 RepID=A0A316F7Z6_9BURK|nr:uncharacterized protein DUF1439 [Cupriavidus plantarum]REE88890.1 uncharacterized protein DUF1439 [Cupriavidus plantarum]RLK31194.1 uncharacterized protein DUF1439 [Cupriavidus plantarum]CAG2153341.1 hypothetical protein LMG26296_05283 [Cupriavidus plantarum]SMR86307.1 Protein of unknown function [Cupriavidus plantarum]
MFRMFRAVTAVTIAAGMTALCGAAYAGYNIWTGEYTFSKAELQTAVDKRFPTTLRYGELVSVKLSHPRLTLDGETNRVITLVDAALTNTILPAPPVNGSLALNSGIRYDATQRAVLLDNPTVDQVQVQGMPQYNEQLKAIGAVVAQQLLKDYPLYTFKPDELKLNGTEIVPGAITVAPDGIRVQVNQK